MSGKLTGIVDREGQSIRDGDWVSLDGNITADDSLGSLPNGWIFDEKDAYRVIWDTRMQNAGWGLALNCEPDTAYNRKYMSHAVGLLREGDVTVVPAPGTM